jgi:hypothetical protein
MGGRATGPGFYENSKTKGLQMAVKNYVKTTTPALVSSAERTPKILETVIDAAADNIDQNDIVLTHYIPPFHRVQGVLLRVLTAQGATATADVGIYSDAGVTAVDADGLLNDANCNAATLLHSAAGGADLAAKGYVAPAAGAYIGVLANHNLTKAVVSLKAEIQNWG